MSILDNAKQHFIDTVNGGGMQMVDVPEWEAEIYFLPITAMNGAQYQKYFEAASKQNFDGMVDLLIQRARDKDGGRMFKPSDKKQLMAQASPTVITDIVGRMAEIDNQSDEAVKK